MMYRFSKIVRPIEKLEASLKLREAAKNVGSFPEIFVTRVRDEVSITYKGDSFVLTLKEWRKAQELCKTA